jgi:hypothetical protein
VQNTDMLPFPFRAPMVTSCGPQTKFIAPHNTRPPSEGAGFARRSAAAVSGGGPAVPVTPPRILQALPHGGAAYYVGARRLACAPGIHPGHRLGAYHTARHPPLMGKQQGSPGGQAAIRQRRGGVWPARPQLCGAELRRERTHQQTGTPCYSATRHGRAETWFPCPQPQDVDTGACAPRMAHSCTWLP